MHLTEGEREALIDKYAELHDRDLIADIKSETSGDFEDILVAMVQSWMRLSVY